MMKHPLLAIASSAVLLCSAALPAQAQDPQTFQIFGLDSRRGPFVGQVTLTPRLGDRAYIQRTITFQRTGQVELTVGTIPMRGERARGIIRKQASLTDLGQPEEGRQTLLQIRIADDGSCRGVCLSSDGASRFEGVQQSEPAQQTPIENAQADETAEDAQPDETAEAPPPPDWDFSKQAARNTYQHLGHYLTDRQKRAGWRTNRVFQLKDLPYYDRYDPNFAGRCMHLARIFIAFAIQNAGYEPGHNFNSAVSLFVGIFRRGEMRFCDVAVALDSVIAYPNSISISGR